MMVRAALVMLIAAVSVTGCNRSDGQGLPPPSGSGVAPPAIPRVDQLMTEEGRGGSGAANGATALAATGTLYPREQADLGPKVTGVLTAVLAEEGDRVKKGQLLFRIDAGHAVLAVQQARALLESAEVNSRAAELDYQRTKELHQRGSVAVATFDQMQARYDSARNAVEQARVALSMAQRSSADTAVFSPLNGVVSDKLKSVGETVTMMPPTTVLVVQDVSVLELRVRLPERSLSVLAPGTMIHVSIPAARVERDVAVKRINPAVDVATRSLEVIADVDNKDGQLKPGMLVQVSLTEPAGQPAAGAAPGSPGAGGAAPAGSTSASRKSP
ncbi:MAG TPA: efflux RND transporter periplasmic adaptor subunit [Polyangiaceae bacterium]|nr:efflux RND transporter periplasmic adaptor subunit [Polyangiaceae bacterium]